MMTYVVYEITQDGSIYTAKEGFATEEQANQWISKHQSDYRNSELFVEREVK